VITLLEMALGGGLVLVGFVLGRVHRPARTVKPVAPICACGHPLSTHRRDTNECVKEIKHEYWTSSAGTVVKFKPCPCVRYVGPEPLPEVWIPPAATTGDGSR
jgi:hypothetical protein